MHKRKRRDKKRPPPQNKRRRKGEFRMIRTTGEKSGALILLPAVTKSSVEDVSYYEFSKALHHHEEDEVAYANWQCPCPYGYERVFHMNSLEVQKALRRQGIGTFVLRHILTEVVPKCFPGTTFLSGEFNHNAMKFWKANGLIRITDEILRKEPQLQNYTWCIPLPPKKKE